jgi:bla regulator protein blaR1
MVAELWTLLVSFTVAVSVAVATVVILRPLVMRAFGVRIAYGLWLLVPALACAAIAPGPATYDPMVVTTATLLRNASQPIGNSVHVVTSMAMRLQALFLVVWGIGAIVAVGVALLRQRRYWQSLGKVTRHGAGVIRAERASGPALVGIFRPLLLLPAKFEELHTADERALMLAHEEVHRRRADPLANACGELIRCLQWFNPLMHWGQSIYRRDQELACDAIAAGTRFEQRAFYAELLVKTQRSLDDECIAPLGAAWHPVHPLTERLGALRKRAPSPIVLRFGALALGLTVLVLAYGGWSIRAEAAAAAGGVPIALHINWSVEFAPKGSTTPGDLQKRSLTTDTVVPSGANLQLFLTSPAGKREFELTCTPKVMEPPPGAKPSVPIAQIWVGCEFKRQDGSLFGSPQIITGDNKEASMEFGDSDGAGGKLLYRLTINPSTTEARVKQAQAAQKSAHKSGE